MTLQQVECRSRYEHPTFSTQPDNRKTCKGETIFKYFCFGKGSFVGKENMSLLWLFQINMTNFYYSFSFSYSEYYGTNEIKALWDS